MKLDNDTIGKFVLVHGEKVVMGVVGLIALLMVVFAFVGKESVGAAQVPAEIRQRANDARVKLITTPPRPPRVPHEGPPVAPEKLDPTPFKGIHLTESIQQKRRRPEPEFIPAQDVRVRVVRGHLGVKSGRAADGGAGAAPNLRGFKGAKRAAAFRVAVVTSLVPLGLQRSRYDDAFRNTIFPEGYTGAQDTPEYYRCILERAEIKPGVADDPLTWVVVNEADNDKSTDEIRDPAFKREMDKWAGVVQPDLVNPSLVEPWLVYPNARPMAEEGVDQWLPPLLRVDWERETVVHPAIIAAEEEATAKRVQAKPAAGDADEGDDAEKIKKFAASYPFRMLRCYDFSIQPGKKYKYRVVLVLRNPNRGIDERYLQSPKLREGNFRTAPPSQPSAVVQVPDDVAVLAGAGVPVSAKQREPGVTLSLSVLAETKDATDRAMVVAKSLPLPKEKKERLIKEAHELAAAWANVDKVWATIEHVATRGMFLKPLGETPINHPVKEITMKLKVIAFDTGHCLVDFTGGTKKSAAKGLAKTAEPTQILLLDPDGRLVIRHEAEDRAADERQKPAPPPPVEKKLRE